jgi:hypothetical protein
VSCDPAGLIDGLNLYRYSRNAPTVYTDGSGQDPDPVNNEQTKKDDEALKAIGVTRQQVIDYADMSRGDFREKYGGSGFFGQLRFRLSFPSDKVEALPSALLYRVLPKKDYDHTVYMFPSGRMGTKASETVNRAKEIQVPTGTGAVLATGGFVLTGKYDPALQRLGDNAEGVASGAAFAHQNRASNSAGVVVVDKPGGIVGTRGRDPMAPTAPARAAPGGASPRGEISFAEGARADNPKNLPSPKELDPSFPEYNTGHYGENCDPVADKVDRWLGGSKDTTAVGDVKMSRNIYMPHQALNIDAVKGWLEEAGPGARGKLSVGFSNGTMHVVNVVNWNGSIIAIDNTNMTYGTVTQVVNNGRILPITGIWFRRTF